ncbi:MAG: FKBP-type peptidyl-prolyl cis-trans isomerase [Bacteroidales bacterium]|nr:FKBP-type peptidyl-prolyl cis-trans isomerase [Bacteroidales bacterium]
MKKYIIPILICCLTTLALVSCDSQFDNWRQLNETWIKNHESQLGQDADIVSYGITHTGLQYEVFHYGYGKVPKSTSKIKVNYKLWLYDGTLVQSSEDVELTLSNCVAAWQEFLPTLHAGSHCKIYAPAEICYGSDGSKSSEQFRIPPYSALTFEIELIDVWQQLPEEE